MRTILFNYYEGLLSWREKNLPVKQFIILLSFIVGVFSALTAWLLKSLIHMIQGLLTVNFSTIHSNPLYLLYPVLGILISGLFVKYVVKDSISHGVTRVLFVISQRKSIIKLHNIWTSILASAVTIGFGGSVGAEAPVVLTGAAVGSNLGRVFKMDQKTIMLMVGCGAGGAISGIFKAPITGVLFTLEILMLDMTMASVIPLLISSVTAATLAHFLMGDTVMFELVDSEAFSITRIPSYLLLGVFCGFISLYFTRIMTWLERQFGKFDKFYKKLLLGGLLLSALIYLMPPLYGEGYDSINAILHNDYDALFKGSLFYAFKDNVFWVVLYISLILLFKVFASSATNAAGGVGGIFAPTLFIGCLAGAALALVLHEMGIDVPMQNFALAGMAGVMSGVMFAPLTGIFLIAEITGGYSLFIPLMIVSTVAYLTIILFEPHSIYATRLAKKGELMSHHKDKAVLSLMSMDAVIETNLHIVHPSDTLGDLVKVISQSKRNLFPVVDDKGVFLGVVTLEEIRNIMFRPELYDRFKVRKLMVATPAKVFLHESMEKVMEKFEHSHAWNLPVLDGDKYVGFVSKSNIFSAYRELLVEFSDE